jgi:RND superfamily putative drug exporter
MFKHFRRYCASHPWLVCVAWLVAGGLLTLIAPNWDARTQDDDVRFLPERCTSVRAYQILEKAFPQDVFASRLIFAVEREQGPLNEADFALVDRMVGDLQDLRQQAPDLKIGSITSHRDGLVGSRLTSADGQCTLIQVSLKTPFLALQTQTTVNRAQEVLQHRLQQAGDKAPHLYTTGQAGIGRDLVTATGDSLDNTTLATILLVIVILLFVYRSPLLALVPLITIAASVWVALNLLALMTLIPGVYLVNISKVFAIVILYGAGTDYCLFLISRYREELENGATIAEAVQASVGSVRGALTASAGTVMCGLGLMALAEFAKVRYSGPGIALSLAVALLASLTLTPALLQLLGKLVFWPGRAPMARHRRIIRLADWGGTSRGLWSWISRQVVAHPFLVWGASMGVLLPLAGLGLQVQPDYRATSQLSRQSESLQGLGVLQKHFPAGETGPLTVLLVSDTDWDGTTGRLEIDHLSRGFAKLDNVAEVRSLTQPLGTPLPEDSSQPGQAAPLADLINSFNPKFMNNILQGARKAAREHYIGSLPADQEAAHGRHVTRIDVILKSDPFDVKSQETMKQVQAWLDESLPRTTLLSQVPQAETYGVMVSSHDLASITESDRLRVNTLICIAILLILLVIVRRPLMAVYLLATVLVSYYAALGATMLAGVLWSGEFLYQLDWRVLFFLFTILVAVGEDYNILLMSRVVQEQAHYGMLEGIRRALARTGGTITSCGLIMAGTFATLMLANLTTLLQIGFALAFGVLLDTFVVRPFLVPTFAIFLSKLQSKPPRSKKPPTRKPRKLDRVPPALRLAG